MAEKKGGSFLNFISFISLVCISAVLIITYVLGAKLGTIGAIIQAVAYLVAIGLVAYNAFYYVRSKSVTYKIIYAVAITLVIIYYVLPVLR